MLKVNKFCTVGKKQGDVPRRDPGRVTDVVSRFPFLPPWEAADQRDPTVVKGLLILDILNTECIGSLVRGRLDVRPETSSVLSFPVLGL